MRANRVMKTFVRATFLTASAATLVVSLQGCVLALAGAAGGGALIATDRRTIGTQTEDREIQVKAFSQIANEIPDSHVNVTVFNRRVLLTGEVADAAKRQRAEDITRGINNVNVIVNEIAVQSQSDFSSRANDSYLLGRVKTALIAEKGISANDFKVVAERGNIYLMGLVTVDEGGRGTDVASRVPGVVQVVKVFEYIQPEAAQALQASATAAAGAPAVQGEQVEPTVGAVPSSSINAQPLEQQAPAPVSNATQVRPGNPNSKTGQ
ncbi:BON domain-containing protein [Trinickia fusca]|uniref:BON domain-containing protein n=1 Tax=Trinickia fusca TaxID=2419777 RepID=A0A494X8I6_9BURK|nr:BON domain-containing protein [Trinickia fusca]RKP44349.1 BON domain-containing protein [Trinickia fusca]